LTPAGQRVVGAGRGLGKSKSIPFLTDFVSQWILTMSLPLRRATTSPRSSSRSRRPIPRLRRTRFRGSRRTDGISAPSAEQPEFPTSWKGSFLEVIGVGLFKCFCCCCCCLDDFLIVLFCFMCFPGSCQALFRLKWVSCFRLFALFIG
jgi:hypothetical protein